MLLTEETFARYHLQLCEAVTRGDSDCVRDCEMWCHVVVTKIAHVLDLMPFSLSEVYRRIGGTCFLYLRFVGSSSLFRRPFTAIGPLSAYEDVG
jgi:hypothetical protein